MKECFSAEQQRYKHYFLSHNFHHVVFEYQNVTYPVIAVILNQLTVSIRAPQMSVKQYQRITLIKSMLDFRNFTYTF